MSKSDLYRDYRFLEIDLKTISGRDLHGKALSDVLNHMYTQLNRLADLHNSGQWADETR